MSEEQLNGSQRVLLDKVISADECRQLQRLSNVSRNLGSSVELFPGALLVLSSCCVCSAALS